MATQPDAFRSGDLLRIRDERWRVTRWLPFEGATVLEVAGQDRSNRGTQARFLLPFERVERVTRNAGPRAVRPAEWRRVARAVLADALPSWNSLRTPLRADMTIAPFQLEPALAMLSGACSRMLIADEVGLGKTVQAGLLIAELLAREPDARAIVVCPAGLREQWRDELSRRYALAPAMLDSVTIARHASASEAGVNPWAAEPLVLTSI